MSSVGQMMRFNVRKEDEEAYATWTNSPAAIEPFVPVLEDSQGEQRVESEVRLWREVSHLGEEDPWSERVHANVKGKENAGHECSFYCRCWTDE